MSNLIITIISIALVAVAALMGAYYGGAAFLQGQSKSTANTMISNAQQIAAAIDVWRANHPGVTDISNDLLAGLDFLVSGGYLTQIPEDPQHTGFSRYSCDGPSVVNNFSNFLSNTDSGCESAVGFAPSRYIIMEMEYTDGSAPSVCREIEKIARGESAIPSATGVIVTGQKMGCVYSSNASTWYFFYSLF